MDKMVQQIQEATVEQIREEEVVVVDGRII